MRRTFDELRGLALGAVDAITAGEDLIAIVVIAETKKNAGETARFACETNVEKGADVGRVLRDVITAIEAL